MASHNNPIRAAISVHEISGPESLESAWAQPAALECDGRLAHRTRLLRVVPTQTYCINHPCLTTMD